MMNVLSYAREPTPGNRNAATGGWPCRAASRNGVWVFPSGLLGSTWSHPGGIFTTPACQFPAAYERGVGSC